MVTIISKSAGSHSGDREMRKVLERDRPTITRIADHLTSGGYSASRAAAAARVEPLPSEARVSRRRPSADAAEPYVRVSPNGRVVLADLATAHQLAFLGEVRRREGQDVFILATAINGFRAPLEGAIADRLATLDGTIVPKRGGARLLSDEIAKRLDLQ